MSTDSLYPDIAVYGAPAVGKSTAREFLERLGFSGVSFAGYHRGGLRDIVQRVGLDPNDREVLNHVGMTMRDLDPDIWVRNALAEIDRCGRPVVVDDLRGDNEWNALGARGFVRIHLVVDNQVREDRLHKNGRFAGSYMPFLWVLEDTERYHPDYVIDTGAPTDETQQALVDILNLERSKRA